MPTGDCNEPPLFVGPGPYCWRGRASGRSLYEAPGCPRLPHATSARALEWRAGARAVTDFILAGQLAHEHHDRIGEARFELGEVLGKLEQAALPEGELAGWLAYAGERLLDRPAKDAADGFEPREADPVDPLLVFVRLLIGDPDQLGKPLLRDAESYSALRGFLGRGVGRSRWPEFAFGDFGNASGG
jgi:hypothetical protein